MKKLALILTLFTIARRSGRSQNLAPWRTAAVSHARAAGCEKQRPSSFAANVTPDTQILDFMNAFAEAMRIHDGKSLKPFLSDRYTIEDLPEGHGSAADFFMQAMVKIKGPDEIVITGIEREGEARIAKTEFRSTERGTKERTFKFDANGKLLNADFFTLKRQ